MTHYYHHYPATRMRCIRAVCLLFAALWGFSETTHAVDFRMKSVSPDFLLSDASAGAGTFENVNTISETLYFRGRSAATSSRYLSDSQVQSFGSGGMSATPDTYVINSAADICEWMSAGGGINTSSQIISIKNNLSSAEEASAFPVHETYRPQQAVAYSNSHYYTVSAQQKQALASTAYPVYRPILTQIGSEQAAQMAYTSESETASSTPRTRRGLTPGLTDPGRDTESPVGEAWALLALAVLYAGYTFRHKKETATCTQEN